MSAQNWFTQTFTKVALTAQYAGSTGLFTVGTSLVSKKNRVEFGLLYGRVPRFAGGVNNSLVFKFVYNPFQLKLSDKVLLEPLQGSLFINQNFSKDFGVFWDKKYPKGYYWWNRSPRFHFSISTQISHRLKAKHIEKLTWYMEANTNDLYLSSYLENINSFMPHEIFFLGTGIKVYLK